MTKEEQKKVEQVRMYAPGYVGAAFASKASDEDILQMLNLKDEKARIYNSYIADLEKKIEALNKKYGIKYEYGGNIELAEGGDTGFFSVIVDEKNSNVKILRPSMGGSQGGDDGGDNNPETPDNIKNPFDDGGNEGGPKGQGGQGQGGQGQGGSKDDSGQKGGEEGGEEGGDMPFAQTDTAKDFGLEDDDEGNDISFPSVDTDEDSGLEDDQEGEDIQGFTDTTDAFGDDSTDEDESFGDKIKRIREEQERARKNLERMGASDLEAIQRALGVSNLKSDLPSKKAAMKVALRLNLFDTMNTERIINAVNFAFK